MKNIDITEWMLNNHIDSDTEIIMNGKQVFLSEVLEKHLKEQFAISAVVGRIEQLVDFCRWYNQAIPSYERTEEDIVETYLRESN